MGTPSLVSDCPSGASPLRVAKTPTLFRDWMVGANIVISEIEPPEGVTNHFNELYHLQVPKSLAQVPLTTDLHNQAEFQLAVHTWASTLPSAEGDASVEGDVSVEGDEYGILTALPYLALAYSRVCKTSNNHSKEHTQRRGIGDVIELAFSSKVDRHCDYITEQSYRLVASAGNLDAQSDALVTIPLGTVGHKIRKALRHGNPTLLRQLYWSTGAERDDFSIIGFAGEFKKDDNECNENQLIMVLASAQAQRKALSLKPSIIMGATACRGRVQIFSSYLEDDGSSVCIYAHKQQFDLSDPIQMIRLYVFCSKLEKHLQSTLASELDTWNPPTDMATLQCRMWRSPDHTKKRRRTGTGESSNGTNGGRGGGNNGPVDADGFDGDKHMNIMKWRDEVVKDVMEGRVVSDEDNILGAPSGWLRFEGRAIAPLS